jgi:argininosuccinate lyase
MVDRDRERFEDCLKRINRSPLGAGALAGVPYPIDRAGTARHLGFPEILENSIDAVSDRDVQIEFLAACAVTMMHLSRLAEECILWTSREWQLAEIGDSFTTGSSIMPQKKNPDIAELVRGKTGRVYGDLFALLTVMKGLPLSYNRDLQEDKEPLFDAVDTLTGSLSVFARLLSTVRFLNNPFQQNPQADFVFATDLADYLVRKGMPFRSAHGVVGKIVGKCVKAKIGLRQLPLALYRIESALFEKDLFALLDPLTSIDSKMSAGSTSSGEVNRAIRRWTTRLKTTAAPGR